MSQPLIFSYYCQHDHLRFQIIRQQPEYNQLNHDMENRSDYLPTVWLRELQLGLCEAKSFFSYYLAASGNLKMIKVDTA